MGTEELPLQPLISQDLLKGEKSTLGPTVAHPSTRDLEQGLLSLCFLGFIPTLTRKLTATKFLQFALHCAPEPSGIRFVVLTTAHLPTFLTNILKGFLSYRAICTEVYVSSSVPFSLILLPFLPPHEL